MNKEHLYKVNLNWKPNDVPTSERTYSRNYEISYDDKDPIKGSNGATFNGPTNMYDPESLLLSSVASCFHLSLLFTLNRNKIELSSYEDNPILTLSQEQMKFEITKIDLYPKIVLKNKEDIELVKELIPLAKKGCFVGQTLKFEYRVSPTISAE